MVSPPLATPDEQHAWPDRDGRRIVFLLDGASRFETGILENWVQQNRPAGTPAADFEEISLPPSRRRRRRRLDPRLEASLARQDDPLLAPLRIVWMPGPQSARRWLRFLSLVAGGDPRDPSWPRQRWLWLRHPERCRVVAGAPAPASELRERWRNAGGSDTTATTGLADFVARQAALALERAERHLRGARYKVPRLVREEILGRPAFRGELARLARELGSPENATLSRASRYLREIAATHSRHVIDLAALLIRGLYSLGYGEALLYDRHQLDGIYRLAKRHPVVFLPSHRSNLDHLVLQYMLHENGLPQNHTAGGINMNFFPVGPLVRRSGVFFIRRSFRDNAVYKLVLRSYIDYLIEKRFSLEWYLEGGRSRSGKLLPPRFGLLAYVVGAFRRGKSEDVVLIPVSIAYDQLQDVGSYAREQRGATKQKESFSWFIGMVRKMHRRYGNIHIRFGEPLSLREHLPQLQPNPTPAPDERNLELQKIAFEVSVRINRATPITPSALLTLALLGAGDRAQTIEQTLVSVTAILRYVESRKLPSTTELEYLASEAGVRRTLEALAENGVVSCYDDGPETVYAIAADQQLSAAYYRNTIVHFFVNGAIAELALLRAAECDGDEAIEEFWAEAMRLRDLLKFEFFFADKDRFREELSDEVAFHDLEWQQRLSAEENGAQIVIRSFRPFSAHRVLRPFLESYQIVADRLARQPADQPLDESAFLAECIGSGKQYLLQRRIRSAASVSKVVFQTALRLAENRGLLAVGGTERTEARTHFAEEIRDALRRIDAIESLVVGRRAGFNP